MNQTTNPKGETIMSMMKEFKEFAMRGNVVDMAVGIIILEWSNPRPSEVR
jgi:hypothetical protein